MPSKSSRARRSRTDPARLQGMNQPTRPDPPDAAPVTDDPPAPANPLGDPSFVAGLRPIPTGPVDPAERWPAADIVGQDLDGRTVELRIGSYPGPLLLCFLQVRCDGCEEFWAGLADRRGPGWPDSLSLVAVTKGPDSVDRVEVARAAAGAGRGAGGDERPGLGRLPGHRLPVLRAGRHGSRGRWSAETVGFGWSEVSSMVRATGTPLTDPTYGDSRYRSQDRRSTPSHRRSCPQVGPHARFPCWWMTAIHREGAGHE